MSRWAKPPEVYSSQLVGVYVQVCLSVGRVSCRSLKIKHQYEQHRQKINIILNLAYSQVTV